MACESVVCSGIRSSAGAAREFLKAHDFLSSSVATMPQQGHSRRSNPRILLMVIAWFLFLYGSSYMFGTQRSIRIRTDPDALVFIR